MTDEKRERPLAEIQHTGPEPIYEEVRERAKRARKRVAVTHAQRLAAQSLMKRAEITGQNVSNAVRLIADAE